MPVNSRAHRAIAIGLVSAALILLQVTVTRILSVVLWYHWAFFAISLAMLGLGAPGVWFSFRRPGSQVLSRLLLAGGWLVPVGIVAIVRGAHLGPSPVLVCLFALLPAMLCLGASVVILLLEAEGPRVARIYAADLFGACLGALLVVPLMALIPTPQLAAATGLLPLLAHGLVTRRSGFAAAMAVALLALLWVPSLFAVTHSKDYAERGPRRTPIFEQWTPTSRITVFDNVPFLGPNTVFGWSFGTVPPDAPPPEQYWIEQDGSAGTPITRFAGDLEEHSYLFHDVTMAGYELRPPGRVAIVGTGGGRDVLAALLAGARAIDAIEINPAIISLVRDRLRAFSGGVYDLPGVRAVNAEGRSALTRSSGNYDLIQISLADSFAATSAGAFALAEANLYTLEAYRLYWSRLSENGIVSTSRWSAGRFGFELIRLLFLVDAALRAEGIQAPENHIAVFQAGLVGTVLMSRSPFDGADRRRLAEIAVRRGFDLHMPVARDAKRLPSVARAYRGGTERFADQGFQMEAPSDDRPFFFQMVSPLAPAASRAIQASGVNSEGVAMLRDLMLAMAVITLVLFFTPFAFARRLAPTPGFWRGSLFFTSIGLSFMLVEIAWVQRFILYLGHPSLSTPVCLASLLLGAGLGSASSTRLGVGGAARWGWLVPMLLVLLNASFAPLFAATLGFVLPARIALAVASIAPAGFCMGFFFPLGLARFGDSHKAWFWALNGSAGVLASVGSLALAMQLGFSNVAYLGALLYGFAWLLLGERRIAQAS